MLSQRRRRRDEWPHAPIHRSCLLHVNRLMVMILSGTHNRPLRGLDCVPVNLRNVLHDRPIMWTIALGLRCTNCRQISARIHRPSDMKIQKAKMFYLFIFQLVQALEPCVVKMKARANSIHIHCRFGVILGEPPTSPRCAPGVHPVPHAQALEKPRKARVSPRCRTTKLGRVPEVNENCNLHSDKRSQLWAKKTSDYRQPELLKKVDSSAVFIYIKRTCCSSRRSMSTAISTQMRHPHSERNKFR